MDKNTDKCRFGLLSCKAVNTRDGENRFTLQPLPYAGDALEPYISARTLQYHHGKHLAAYIDNTNRLKAGTPAESLTIGEIVLQAEGGLFNNAAQVFNHYFYFEALQPAAPEQVPERLEHLLDENFGSLAAFKEKFAQAAAGLFGSGWVWLVQDGSRLEILQMPNASNPLKEGKHPLLTLDVWEHAYYLDTQNARPAYVQNFWHVLNWKAVAERLL